MVQFLEVVRIEGHAFSPEDVAFARDMYLLQVKVKVIVICVYVWAGLLILFEQRVVAFSVNDFYLPFLCNLMWQLCSGVDENAIGACAQLVFAPIDESFADDALLLPSGFRVIPLDPKTVQ